jgi:hypothetical protein
VLSVQPEHTTRTSDSPESFCSLIILWSNCPIQLFVVCTYSYCDFGGQIATITPTTTKIQP